MCLKHSGRSPSSSRQELAGTWPVEGEQRSVNKPKRQGDVILIPATFNTPACKIRERGEAGKLGLMRNKSERKKLKHESKTADVSRDTAGGGGSRQQTGSRLRLHASPVHLSPSGPRFSPRRTIADCVLGQMWLQARDECCSWKTSSDLSTKPWTLQLAPKSERSQNLFTNVS